MPSSRPPYSPEFRRQAVELVRSCGQSLPQIADELGVEDVPVAVELCDGDPVGGLSQAGDAATFGAAVATVV